jgi:hypothetical protein
MKKSIIYIGLSAVVLFPAVSFAALGGLRTLLGDIKGIIDLVFPILYGLGFVYFFWGIGQFILNDSGNEKTRDEGKNKILWGVIALFIMFSIRGILSFISSATDVQINTNSLPTNLGTGGVSGGGNPSSGGAGNSGNCTEEAIMDGSC